MTRPHDFKRNSSQDWPFPFSAPGRPKKRALPARTESRWPFTSIDALDSEQPPPVFVRSPVSVESLKKELLGFADDVGVISIDHPAIAHERDEIRYVYPHAKSLICLIGKENKAAMQSRYLPTANHELYTCEERIFEMGRRTIEYIETLGGAGLTTTIGWPQEVSQRWADKIWPLSHRLVAQAAGLGVIGTSRNFLHKKFGAYCLIDTVVSNLEFPDREFDQTSEWNPCLNCNLCVASCPTDAIKSDGDFDFFACYNHTYRDSIPGFLDLVQDLGAAKPKRFAKRWNDSEIAALWQSLSFKVEYRCFNCVATCPAEIHGPFHADRGVRRDYLDHVMKPLAHTRRHVEEQFVIDTPSAREEFGIPPGQWRTRPDITRPNARGTRLVNLQRIRTSNIDSMMRNMPHYFRGTEARGLDFVAHLAFSGDGGGDWTLRIAEQRCQVVPEAPPKADLRLRCDGSLFLRIHRGETSPVWALITGRLRLDGRRELFLHFARLFPSTLGNTLLERAQWYGRRIWQRIQKPWRKNRTT